ncbi:urocortin [Chiroxiphia lanceolata]|uniref:urocortin n=1 Tax=Chiroxiphia lanceolata TaxID=296741 RepID=UPI0013CEE540|nr:urocortin [Chiroxiphia lanceolata]
MTHRTWPVLPLRFGVCSSCTSAPPALPGARGHRQAGGPPPMTVLSRTTAQPDTAHRYSSPVQLPGSSPVQLTGSSPVNLTGSSPVQLNDASRPFSTADSGGERGWRGAAEPGEGAREPEGRGSGGQNDPRHPLAPAAAPPSPFGGRRNGTGAAAPESGESTVCPAAGDPLPRSPVPPPGTRSPPPGAPRSHPPLPPPAAPCVPGADVSPGSGADITPGRAAGSAPAGRTALAPPPAPAATGDGHSAPGSERPRMRRALLTLLLLLARSPPVAALPTTTDGSVPAAAAGIGARGRPLWPPLAPPAPGQWRGRRDEPPLSIDLTFHLLRHLLLLARAQSQRARADSNRRILDAVGR